MYTVTYQLTTEAQKALIAETGKPVPLDQQHPVDIDLKAFVAVGGNVNDLGHPELLMQPWEGARASILHGARPMLVPNAWSGTNWVNHGYYSEWRFYANRILTGDDVVSFVKWRSEMNRRVRDFEREHDAEAKRIERAKVELRAEMEKEYNGQYESALAKLVAIGDICRKMKHVRTEQILRIIWF